jgi:Protein of unknown function (DUF3347)
MKKVVIVVVLLALVAFGAYKIFFARAGNGTAEPKQQALGVSKNSAAFNESFEKLLSKYFSLKDALVEYDTTKANAAAKDLVVLADSLKTEEIKGDSTGDINKIADDLAGTISGSAKGLAGEQDIIKKKREFQMISEALYNLIRTVKYDRQKLYHQHCPMAFNDEEEAWWISNSNRIENPYMGKKHPKYKATMVGCGDITDSLDFSKK